MYVRSHIKFDLIILLVNISFDFIIEKVPDYEGKTSFRWGY